MGVFVKPRNERIATLAALPVFLDLKGKPVLIGVGTVFSRVGRATDLTAATLRLATPQHQG